MRLLNINESKEFLSLIQSHTFRNCVIQDLPLFPCNTEKMTNILKSHLNTKSKATITLLQNITSGVYGCFISFDTH